MMAKLRISGRFMPGLLYSRGGVAGSQKKIIIDKLKRGSLVQTPLREEEMKPR
jgi:hypothetical protein